MPLKGRSVAMKMDAQNDYLLVKVDRIGGPLPHPEDADNKFLHTYMNRKRAKIYIDLHLP